MTTENTLPAKRLENALGRLQEAQSALKLAAEELAIVDAEMIGSDAEQQSCGDCSGGYCGDKYEPCGCDCHDELVRKPEPRPNVPPRMW